MKKVSLFLAICIIALSSCKKYELSEELTIDKTLESFDKVTISGVVTSDFDATNASTNEYVPAGTVLTFSVSYADYGIPMTNPENNRHYFTATVGQNGKYTLDIPVPTHAINVDVTSDDFVHSYKESESLTYDRNFSFSPTTISVNHKTNNNVHNFTFTSSNLLTQNGSIVPTKTVTFSGKMEYISQTHYRLATDGTSLPTEIDTIAVPAGTVVTIHITLTEIGFSTAQYTKDLSVTVGSEGTYSIEVPMISGGVASINMVSYVNLQHKLKNDDIVGGNFITTTETNYFRYDLSASAGIYEYNKTDQNFMFVKGIKLD